MFYIILILLLRVHHQVLEEDDRAADPEQEKRDLQNWFVGKLKCKKHIDDAYRNSRGEAAGSDGRSLLDYEVVDTREMRGAQR